MLASKIATRAIIHSFSGVILLALALMSYYSIAAFIDDSEQPDAPASLLAWCIFTPVFLIYAYLGNQNMLTDPMLPSLLKIVFLLLEVILLLVVIAESLKDPLFACHITECTYTVLPRPEYTDEVTSTWHPESGEAVLALFYFSLGMLLLPLLFYLIYRQLRVLIHSRDTTEHAVQLSLLEYKEKHPDPHNEDGIEMTVTMTENPLLVGELHNNAKIDKVRAHHRDLQRQKIEADKEDNRKRWKAIEELAMEHHNKVSQRKDRTMWICMFLTMGFLFPLNFFCSSRFGNDFQWFSNYGIAAWAKHQIEPPIPQITVSEDLNYKFFPQIIMFYVFLYTVAGAGAISHLFPRVRQFMDTRPVFLKRLDATWGEALFTFMLVGFTWMTFCYVFFDWYAEAHVKWRGSPTSERWGRCLGQTSLFPMGVMILPISRNSIWTTLMNYPGEQMIKFHRWAAIMFLVLAFSHTIAFFGVFHTLGEFPAAIMQSPNSYRREDSTIGMMSGVQFFIVIPAFCILTLNHIRRHYFEVFYYVHVFTSGIFFLATLWHSDFAWMYLVPGLTLYLVDIMVRFNNTVTQMEITKLRALEDDVTEITFAVLTNPGYRKKDKQKGGPAKKGELGTAPEGLHFKMGQYVFINMPSISMAENHPFNIASAQTDKHTTCYIKSMGPGTWTGKLLELSKSMSNSEVPPPPLKYFPIQVEGPYGLPFDHRPVSNLLLVAGGIGITPLHSIMRTLLLQLNSNIGLSDPGLLKKVKLIWSFKNPDLLFGNDAIESTLLMIPPGKAYLRALAKKKLGKSKDKVSRKSSHKSGKHVDRESKVGEFHDVDISDELDASPPRASSSSLSRNGPEGELEEVLAATREQEELAKQYKQLDLSIYPTIGGDVIFEVNLHCTSTARGPGPKVAALRAEQGKGAFWHPLIPKRCEVRSEIGRFAGDPNALVYCVGPTPLIEAAKDACADYAVKFRGETSEF